MRRIAAILAAKGGAIAGITVGDCLELLAGLADGGDITVGDVLELLDTELDTLASVPGDVAVSYRLMGSSANAIAAVDWQGDDLAG